MNTDSFVKKLRQSICGKIISRELNYYTNVIQLYIFIKDVRLEAGKVYLDGVRISGWIRWHGSVEKQELADIDYKLYLDKDGFTSLSIYTSLWTVLMSNLKHFDIQRANVVIKEKMNFLKTKRFFSHIKVYLPLDSTKN
jgi:hypothetical protein